MTQPPVAPQVHQPLDIHGDLAPEVAFHDVVAVDHVAYLQALLVGQLSSPPLFRNSYFRHDFVGLLGPDPMDILQCNNDALIGRYINAGDAGHSYPLLLPARPKWPAILPFDGKR